MQHVRTYATFDRHATAQSKNVPRTVCASLISRVVPTRHAALAPRSYCMCCCVGAHSERMSLINRFGKFRVCVLSRLRCTIICVRKTLELSTPLVFRVAPRALLFHFALIIGRACLAGLVPSYTYLLG